MNSDTQTLPLESPRWQELRQAYGTAGEIPGLLRLLARGPGPDTNAETWSSLSQAVNHQGDVYEAAFAVVPHMVNIALSCSGPCAWNFLGLPASIEVARARDSVAVPPDLAAAYRASISLLPDVVAAHSAEPWDHVFTQAAAAALAVAHGQVRLADAFLELGPDTTERFMRWYEGCDAGS